MEKDIIQMNTNQNSKIPKKWFVADTHYAHINICRGVTQWGHTDEDGVFHPAIESTRDFATVDDMNDAIVFAINSVVGEDDELYHGGDISFNGLDKLWLFRKQIKCKNFHLTFGNHDHHIEKNHVLPNCHWDLTTGEVIVDGPNPNVFGDDRDRYFDVHAQDLFTSVQEILNFKIGKHNVVMCHYPMEQWRDMDRGTWHLHGHCHGNLPISEFKKIDFGLDATGFKVLSENEITEIMSNRLIKAHHER